MTSQGGAADVGSAFTIGADGTGFGLLHSFTGTAADGGSPGFSSLVVSGPTLFGMTGSGGAAGLGTIFRVNADGTGFGLMHSFGAVAGDGERPFASLTLSGSTLYGMTRQGGDGVGTIFKINTDGTGYDILHSFDGGPNDGANPVVDLLLVGSTLYGTTPLGGASNLGTLFRINTDGTGYSVLRSFAGGPGEPANPGGLTTDGSTLYGISGAGGANNLGTIFSIPVPEPSSFLLAAGGLALLARRWRGEPVWRRRPDATNFVGARSQ
jgi:uncharacterized repeat protein (TIGR03803 family)